MLDSELLELAAKAAGYQPSRVTNDGVVILRGIRVTWKPLENDADALRLAVALGIELHFEGSGESYAVWANEIMLWTDGNKFSATRRAIVLAAAEIGKTM